MLLAPSHEGKNAFRAAKDSGMLAAPMRHAIPFFCAVLCVACAYPRRATFVHPAPVTTVKSTDRPEDLWTLRIVGAELPEFKPGGLPWDSDGTPPDPFVRVLVDKQLVWESPALENTRKPEWNVTLPRNIQIPEGESFRLEVWDRDTAVSADPAGHIQRSGLPETALPDAVARLTLDNLANVSVIVSAPRAHQGVGLRFEVRSDALVVLDVDAMSPASRAGIRKGERIVAIGPQRVSELGGDEATSDLSLASERGHSLTVADTKGQERQVTLDKGFIWLTM
jgi:hypothetical protein